MKASHAIWKDLLAGEVPVSMAAEIDTFETEIELRKQDKVDEKVFAETRLRRGAYGQRYDNGQRHDGTESKSLAVPERVSQRPEYRLGRPGDAADQDSLRRHDTRAARSDGRSRRGVFRRHRPRHHAAGLPTALRSHRRYAGPDAASGGGRDHHPRSVRQLGSQRHRLPVHGRLPGRSRSTSRRTPTPSPFTCSAIPIAQNFGRKFKPSFSGCQQHACGLAAMHDLGLIAETRVVDGKEERGFQRRRRRRTRRRAAAGEGVRRVHAARGNPADRPGDRAGYSADTARRRCGAAPASSS